MFCSFRLFYKQLSRHDRGLYSVASETETKPSFLQDGSKLWPTAQDVTAADQASNLRLIFYVIEVNWSFRVLGDISFISVRTAHATICTVSFLSSTSFRLLQNQFLQVIVLSLIHSRLFTLTRHERTITSKNTSLLGLSFSVLQ